jgi:hypothetical protein
LDLESKNLDLIFAGSGLDSRPVRLASPRQNVVTIDPHIEPIASLSQKTQVSHYSVGVASYAATYGKKHNQAIWIMEGVSPYVGADTLLKAIGSCQCSGGWVDLYSKSFLQPLNFLWQKKMIPGFETKEELHRIAAEFAKFGVKVVAFGHASST